MVGSWSLRARSGVLISLAAALAITLAACGSSLDPNEVAVTSATGMVQSGTAAEGAGVPGTIQEGGSGNDADGTLANPESTGSEPRAPGPGSANPGDGPAPTDPPVSGPKQSCEGFENATGITDDTITLGNASDISGPVPGLFEASQDAARAFVAYFNASVPDGICGRKLALKTYDSRTDAGADQQAYAAACDEVFAMIGSTSAFDSGGAETAQDCGLPDVRAASVTAARVACGTCFGVLGVNNAYYQNAVPDFILKNYGNAGQHAGFLYINAGAASENARLQARAMTKRGLNFDYVQGIDVSEFNYAPYVQQLKDRGIEVVFWTGAYQQSVRLRQAMDQQGYRPTLYMRDATDYNPDYVRQGGSAVDGTVVYLSFTPFEESGSNKELATYLSWLQQVRPDATPEFFGIFAWSAARLVAELATGLGGQLTRRSLIDAISKQNQWTGEGIHARQSVGSKGSNECVRFIQLNNGNWRPLGGTKYRCSGLTSTS